MSLRNTPEQKIPDGQFISPTPESTVPETAPSMPPTEREITVEKTRNEQTEGYKEVMSEPTEKIEEDIESTIDSLKRKLKLTKKKKVFIPTIKDEFTRKVEQLMEEGLADAYRELTIVQQQEFKIKGEETAWKIRELFKRSHVKVKEVFKLLVEWLRLLPGINKFFIEQEAKIKADKILSLKKHQSLD